MKNLTTEQKLELVKKLQKLESELFDVYYAMVDFRKDMDKKTKLAYEAWGNIDDLLFDLSIELGIDIQD